MYHIFHIEYTAIEFITNKKEPDDYIPDPPLAGAASLSFQYGEFVNKANCTSCPAGVICHCNDYLLHVYVDKHHGTAQPGINTPRLRDGLITAFDSS